MKSNHSRLQEKLQEALRQEVAGQANRLSQPPQSTRKRRRALFTSPMLFVRDKNGKVTVTGGETFYATD